MFNIYERLTNSLTKEHRGYSGFTHWLIGIFLFFLIWLTPLAIAEGYISSITTSSTFAFIIFLIVGGSSLLADLDSSPLEEGGSTALYQLGLLGHALSIICVVISSAIWNVAHTKYDERPKSQHRMFFHTPFVAICILLFNLWSYPSSQSIPYEIGWKNVPGPVYAIIFLGAISVYLGSSIFFYKTLSLIRRERWTQIFCWGLMVFSVWKMWSMDFSTLKLIGTSIALGYLFHIIGDLTTKGSVPIFFPFPTPTRTSTGLGWKMWLKPYIFNGRFNITTGGAANIILNFILCFANIMIAWNLFIRG